MSSENMLLEEEDPSAPEWRWCLVGNIVDSHEYGEDHEIRTGTKQFAPGAKVYLAPIHWGDGYEKIYVVGKPRHRRGYIMVVMCSRYITNLRLQKVFRPAVLERMANSDVRWWGNTDEDRDEIIEYLDSRNPAAAAKAREGASHD